MPERKQFTIDYGWATETYTATQAEYDEKIANHKAEQEERHQRNHYTLYEAAEVLAGAYDIGDAMSFLRNRMHPAAASGLLRVTDPQDGGPINRRNRLYSDWVTPTAINEWLERDHFSYRWPVPAQNPTAPVPVVTESASVALPRQRAQEARILELLKAQGYDAKKLPDRKSGTQGPKAEIRMQALAEPALFTLKTFDTAWQRLRDAGDVAGAE